MPSRPSQGTRRAPPPLTRAATLPPHILQNTLGKGSYWHGLRGGVVGSDSSSLTSADLTVPKSSSNKVARPTKRINLARVSQYGHFCFLYLYKIVSSYQSYLKKKIDLSGGKDLYEVFLMERDCWHVFLTHYLTSVQIHQNTFKTASECMRMTSASFLFCSSKK